MLDSIIKSVAKSLGDQVGLDKEKIAVITYGMQTIVYTLFGIIGVVIISSIINVLKPALTAFICAALLRNFSGGAHCTSPRKCLLLTVTIFPLLGIVAKFITPYLGNYIILSLIFTAIFCLVCIYIWAPVDTENKRITSFKTKKRLRITSLSIIIILETLLLLFLRNYEIIIIASQLGFLWQSFMLMPLGKAIIKKYDSLLLKERGYKSV